MARHRVYRCSLALVIAAALLLTIALLLQSQHNPWKTRVQRAEESDHKPRNGQRAALNVKDVGTRDGERQLDAKSTGDNGNRHVRSASSDQNLKRMSSKIERVAVRSVGGKRVAVKNVGWKKVAARNVGGKRVAVRNVNVGGKNSAVRVVQPQKSLLKTRVPCFNSSSIEPLLKHEPGFASGKPSKADNPMTMREVEQRSIPRPRGMRNRLPYPKDRVPAMHRCIRPVFIRRSSPNTVALVSLPGSGNTWMRYLLEQSTGIYTGSVYIDRRLYDSGMLGEDIVTSAVSVVKYHTGSSVQSDRSAFCPDEHNVRGVVLLIRNPYDAALSEFNRVVTGSHVKRISAKEIAKNITAWTTFSREVSLRFVDMIRAWSKLNVPVHIVYYEDLKKRTKVELMKVIDFLQLPTTSQLLDCVSANKQGNFKRTGNGQGVPDSARNNQSSLFSSVQINAMDCVLSKIELTIPGIYRRYAKSKEEDLSCK